jgi:hypothetical protein
VFNYDNTKRNYPVLSVIKLYLNISWKNNEKSAHNTFQAYSIGVKSCQETDFFLGKLFLHSFFTAPFAIRLIKCTFSYFLNVCNNRKQSHHVDHQQLHENRSAPATFQIHFQFNFHFNWAQISIIVWTNISPIPSVTITHNYDDHANNTFFVAAIYSARRDRTRLLPPDRRGGVHVHRQFSGLLRGLTGISVPFNHGESRFERFIPSSFPFELYS